MIFWDVETPFYDPKPVLCVPLTGVRGELEDKINLLNSQNSGISKLGEWGQLDSFC